MATPDISKLSAKELQELIATAQSQIDSKRQSELTAHVDLFVKKSKDAGYTLKEVIAELKQFQDDTPKASTKKTGGAGKTRPVKYKSPNGETWSGAGLKPKWLTAQLATGKKLESFAV